MNTDLSTFNLKTDFLKFFLFDVMVAAVFGLMAWIVERDPITSFLISLFTAVALLVVELRFQIGGTKQELAQVLGVDSESLDNEHLMTTLVGAASDYNRVRGFENQLFTVSTDEALRNFTHEMATLREGYMVLNPDEAFPYYVKLLGGMRKTGFFTLMLRVARFWYRSNNRDYIETNLAAAARGVAMTRVVIIEKVEDLTPEVIDIIRVMSAGGIEMRIALEHELAPELIVDMGLYDQDFVAYSDINPGDRGIKGTRILWRDSDLRKAVTTRDRILHESENALQFLERSGLLSADAVSQPMARTLVPATSAHRSPPGSSARREN